MSKQLTAFTTCNNEIVSLTNTGYVGIKDIKFRAGLGDIPEKNVKYIAASGGGRPTEYAYLVGRCACGSYHYAERLIERPAQASNHKCDGRCMNSKGRKCECSCKGKNHGAN